MSRPVFAAGGAGCGYCGTRNAFVEGDHLVCQSCGVVVDAASDEQYLETQLDEMLARIGRLASSGLRHRDRDRVRKASSALLAASELLSGYLQADQEKAAPGDP